jgi:hypothetical protein
LPDIFLRTARQRPLSEALVETIMLICAVFASLTLGVLASYMLCQGMFRVFRVHSLAAASRRVGSPTASISPAVEA